MACLMSSLLPVALATPGALAEPPAYEISARLPVGGEGGWDCLTFDSATNRLFVARSSHVQVVDLVKDSVIGDIPNTPGVHGVALVQDLGQGFTSNGRDSSVTVFDLKTFATLATVRLPARNPDVIVYDPVSKRVFTFNGGSASATAIDASSRAIAGTVALDGRPEFAVPDGLGHMYVNIEDSSLVTCFDTRTLKVLSSWPLAPGEEPSGMAADLKHRRLFSACGNRKLVVLDMDSGKHVADVEIGSGVDGAAFDAGLGLVLTSNGEGTLSVIRQESPDRYSKVADVPSQRGARTLALDETSHRVWVATAEFGETPAPTAERPHPRPPIVAGSFVILGLDARGVVKSGSPQSRKSR
jgi:DNA-binding beta-propeller fold protein YncE